MTTTLLACAAASGLALSTFMVGSTPSATTVAPPARPDVILITIDALRADHLSAYGQPRLTSPMLDAFSRQATLFANAITQAPFTKAAVASLMSGLYPTSHKAVTATVPFVEAMTGRPTTAPVETDILASSITTLAESFHADGYVTLGYTGNPFLIAPFGFAQGFDQFQFFPGGDFADANVIIDRALHDIARTPSRPVFLWVHLMEPHSPYAPPTWTQGLFPPTGRPHPIPVTSAPPSWLLKGSPSDLRAYESRYDEEIAAVDIAVDSLFRGLADDRRLDEAIVTVVADHGEEFLDHGGWEHGTTLYDELVRVPLVMRVPHTVPRRVDAQVQLIDLYPTLLQLARVPAPVPLAGRSFVDLLSGGHGSEPAYTELPPRACAVRADGWKFITFADAREELYDLQNDPGEHHNLAASEPRRAATLRRLIDRHIAAALKAGQTISPEHAPVDARVLEQLRALGYVDR
jgi:arylsulfatase A-like enzyme